MLPWAHRSRNTKRLVDRAVNSKNGRVHGPVHGPCTRPCTRAVYTGTRAVYTVYSLCTRPVFTGCIHDRWLRVACTEPNTFPLKIAPISSAVFAQMTTECPRQTDNGPTAYSELFYKRSPKNGWTYRFSVWVVDSGGPKEAQVQSYSPGGANVGTLAPPGEYDWTVCMRRRCGLLPNYFDHLYSCTLLLNTCN